MDYFAACRSCSALIGPLDDPLLPKLNCCTTPSPEPWPSTDAIHLLDVAKEQLMERRGGRRVAAVFLASAFERLLEEATRPLLRARDKPRGQSEWRALFEERTSTTVPAVLAGAGMPAFDRNWKHLVRLRNQIAHGAFAVEATMDGAILKGLCKDAVRAFAALARAGRAAARQRRGPVRPASRRLH
jgi:hypothetical protein